jgi:Aldehyde dehydrogenase family
MSTHDLTLIAGTNVAALPEKPFLARHLIDGAWCDSADGATFERRSPAHGTLVSVAARGGTAETDAAIATARRAFADGPWPHLSGKDRSALLLRVADLIERDRHRIALTETLETGKPISQARAEIEGAADLWRYAAALARTLHGDSHNSLGPDMLGVVLKEPVGVAAIITPWKFPFLIVSQKLPFALAAGCTAVVKPSELTPSTTVIPGELLLEGGLPAGVANIVLGYGQPVGALMSTDPRVDMVTFTGSTGVGKSIVAAASGTLKKSLARARRQEPASDLPRRRSRERGRCDRPRRLLQRRRVLQFRLADHRARGHRRSRHRTGGSTVPQGPLRRAARSRHQGRRDRLTRAPGEDRRLRPRRGRRRCKPAPRRRRSAGAGSCGPVLPADGGRWRDRGHGDRPRGVLRAGALGPDLPQPGRSPRPGQRRGLWPVGRRVEREHPHLPRVRAPRPGRHRLDQYLDGRFRRASVRRRQGERAGARTRALRDRRVYRSEDPATADRPHAGTLVSTR